MKYNSNLASELYETYNMLSELTDVFNRLRRKVLFGVEDEKGNFLAYDASNGCYDFMIEDTLRDFNVESVSDLFPFNDSWDESTLSVWCLVMQKIVKELILQEMEKRKVEL